MKSFGRKDPRYRFLREHGWTNVAFDIWLHELPKVWAESAGAAIRYTYFWLMERRKA